MAASLFVSKVGVTVLGTVAFKSCTAVRKQSTDVSFSGNFSKFKFTNSSSRFGFQSENHSCVISAKANRGSKKTKSHSSKSVVIVDKDEEVADKQSGGEDNWDSAFTEEIKNKHKKKSENQNENEKENENENESESNGWDVAREIESELNAKPNGKTEVHASKKKKGKKGKEGKAVNEEKQVAENQVNSTEEEQVETTENNEVVSAENNEDVSTENDQVVSTGNNVAALIDHIFSDKFDELATNRTTDVNQAKVLPAHKETYGSLMTASLNKLHQDASEKLSQLNDTPDEKFVHDMRVTLRRLRTAVVTFEPFIDISKEANAKNISKLLRVLGTLRDKDVMQETFNGVKNEAENMETVEVDHVETVQKRMKAERAKLVSSAVTTLRSKSAVLFFQSLDNWLKKPCFKKEYRALVDSPSRLVVPALLLQHITPILLHPGWHVDDLGLKNENRTLSPTDGLNSSNGSGQSKGSKESRGLDQRQCDTVHDLRKGLRELRYSMELFSSVYGERELYGNVLANIRKLQGFLGDLQDLQVLATYLNKKLSAKAPNIHLALADSQNKAWRSWLEERGIVYEVSGQRGLLKAISRPRGPKKETVE